MAITGKSVKKDKTQEGFIVYRALFPNGKSYIGITSKGLDHRKKVHKKDAIGGCNYAFHHAIRKYGWESVQWEILDTRKTWKAVQKLEQIYIAKFDSYKDNNGYNMTLGGEGAVGLKHTDECKLKMSLAKKGKPQHPNSRSALDNMFKNGHPRVGLKHSEETRKKISDKAKTRPFPAGAHKKSIEVMQRPVVCYNKDGSFVAEFSSASNAYRWLGKNPNSGSIGSCCKGKRKTALGYKWSYKENT